MQEYNWQNQFNNSRISEKSEELEITNNPFEQEDISHPDIQVDNQVSFYENQDNYLD